MSDLEEVLKLLPDLKAYIQPPVRYPNEADLVALLALDPWSRIYAVHLSQTTKNSLEASCFAVQLERSMSGAPSWAEELARNAQPVTREQILNMFMKD